jgi:hypothetical protein
LETMIPLFLLERVIQKKNVKKINWWNCREIFNFKLNTFFILTRQLR